MPSASRPARLAVACLLAAGHAASAGTAPNPLLQKWTGPYGGVPPFDRITVEHFQPALEAAMAENLKEVDAIAADPAPPTFENTIVALERSGRALNRVAAIYGVFSSTLNGAAFQKVQQAMAPRLAEFGDKITQNQKLFARVAAVYDARDQVTLTPEQKRLLWVVYTGFARNGARLQGASKERLSAINQRLATLYTTFTQDLLADEADYALDLDKEEDLAGLPEGVRAGAASAAQARDRKSGWSILNTRSSMEPFLTYSSRRDLREKVWKTYYSRCDHGDAKDTKKRIAEILKLRAERARLLGFADYPSWRLDNMMAKDARRALDVMEAVWTPAVARVRQEVADMQAVADREGAGIRIEPWDYRYYAEKVRKATYDLDQNELTPYLRLDKMREALFYTAGRLFGLSFRPAKGVPVVQRDVEVWEVTDAAGRHVGLWFFDPYARPGKNSGAWMDAYRSQERLSGDVTPIVSNNTNFVKGEPGEPLLISWDDATALFHEFGHALHGLLSNVTYPTLAGTSVPTDYGEVPSMVLQHWLETPDVLTRFALHVKTGKPMPRELVDKVRKASTFNQGFATVEYLASALVDMKLHLAATPGEEIDVDRFEKETLAGLGMPKEIVMRHRTPQFGHLWSSDNYAAGYYSYLWSEVFAADGWEAFTEAGDPWDAKVAKRFRDHVFSVGNTVDPADGYRAFRGRDAKIDALMRQRGFPVN